MCLKEMKRAELIDLTDGDLGTGGLLRGPTTGNRSVARLLL